MSTFFFLAAIARHSPLATRHSLWTSSSSSFGAANTKPSLTWKQGTASLFVFEGLKLLMGTNQWLLDIGGEPILHPYCKIKPDGLYVKSNEEVVKAEAATLLSINPVFYGNYANA